MRSKRLGASAAVMLLAAAALVLVPASIGSLLGMRSGDTAASRSSRVWRANASQLIAQLRADVDAVESIEPSRHLFRDVSLQFVLLVAYTDLAGCAHMAENTGAPPASSRCYDGPARRSSAPRQRSHAQRRAPTPAGSHKPQTRRPPHE
jgi:hypothetical protein